MINQHTIQGNWNVIKGKLRSKWGSLTDEDLTIFDGNVDQLVGTIERRTGEARESIEHFFEQLTADGASAISRASESVRGYAQQAADTVQETSRKAATSVRDGFVEVEDLVRQRPAISVAFGYGAGVISGLVLGLLLRRR